MQVQCIPVHAEDGAVIEALSAFATEIVREHFDPIIGAAQNDYMLARSQSASGIREQIEGGARYYIAADQDGKWLGFTAFYPRRNEMYLSKFYVHKSQRGRGVARCMLELMIHAAKAEGLEKIVLNVNLDMIGCIMGKFIACCTSEEALVSYIKYMASELGFGCSAYQDVYSSDSTPFADKGIPAISFARIAPGNAATIHNSYDTPDVMSAEQMVKDLQFIESFVNRMSNAACCPVERKMPENMKEKLDEYLARKRPKNQ